MTKNNNPQTIEPLKQRFFFFSLRIHNILSLPYCYHQRLTVNCQNSVQLAVKDENPTVKSKKLAVKD